MKLWARQFSEIPKIHFKNPLNIDRTQLLGYSLVPKFRIWEDFEGKKHESVEWPKDKEDEFSKGQSPVQEWETQPRAGETTSQTRLRKTLEALELPGEYSDYHFELQSCYEDLWKNRRNEPWAIRDVEQLCWLDLQLVENYPEIITFETTGENHFALVIAYGRLINLYEREGYIQEAYNIAKRAARFKLQEYDLERLQSKLEILMAEESVS